MSELAQALEAFNRTPLQRRPWWTGRAKFEAEKKSRQDLLALLSQLVANTQKLEQQQKNAEHGIQRELASQAEACSARLQAMSAHIETLRQSSNARNKALTGLGTELLRQVGLHDEIIHKQLPQSIETIADQFAVQFSRLTQESETRLSTLATNIHTIKESSKKVEEESRALMISAESMQRQTHAELAGAMERLAALAHSADKPAPWAENDPDFFRFYLGLENKLRGSRELILNRLKQYSPRLLDWSQQFLLKHPNEALLDLRIACTNHSLTPHVNLNVEGIGDLAALDLGCGRGEWLESLVRLGWSNLLGIDSNPRMVEECQGAQGLPAVVGDAIGCLDNLPDGALALVTGFHIVEHLPFAVLLQLAQNAFRVLHSGGLCIFETPNPENLLTASQYFYLDPTHQHPLPPDLMILVLEHAGFQSIEIVRMQPNSDLGYFSDTLPEKHKDPTVQLLLNHFRACRDYAVIGRRP